MKSNSSIISKVVSLVVMIMIVMLVTAGIGYGVMLAKKLSVTKKAEEENNEPHCV